MNKAPILASMALSLLTLAAQAHAGGFNTLMVNTALDVMDGNDGLCSLREAIHNVRNGAAFSAQPGECAAGSTLQTNRILLQSDQVYVLSIPGNGIDEGELSMLVNAPPNDVTLRIETDGASSASIIQSVTGQRVLSNLGAWIEIDNISISGGSSSSGGGAIFNNNGQMSLTRVAINDNIAASGGAIYNASGSNLSIVDSELQLNQANIVAGGAIFNEANAVLSISNTLLRANSANSGGAIYNLGSLEILDGSTLSLNTASSAMEGGGAIHNLDNGTLHVSHSSFSNNTSSGNGGAILHESSDFPMIDDSEFIDNGAVRGGAISQGGVGTGSLTVRRTELRGNTAPGGGGAINSLGSAVIAIGSTFFDNHTMMDQGGAIKAGLGVIVIDSVFLSNTAAGNGGAIRTQRFGMESRNTRFEDNEAGSHGGAVYASVNVHMKGMRVFDNRSGGDGAGVYLSTVVNQASRIVQSEFSGNIAQGQGGGLWLRSPDVTLANSTIAVNSAVDGGGGLYIDSDASVIGVNLTVAGNLVGRDIYKFGDLQLQNSIIASPDQPNCLTSLDNPFINSNGNNISNDNSCAGLVMPSDQINTNPMLASLDFHGGSTMSIDLLPGSPAIDAGNDAACASDPINAMDQRGALRPQTGCDIGAHEVGGIVDVIFADGFEGM